MNIKLNIKPLLDELSHTDLKSFLKGAKNQSVILKNWDSLITALKKISPKIAKGEDVSGDLVQIGKLAGSLSKSVADIGSMIPGPIGVACSLALALACLIPPLDLVGLVLNLMGCLPFVKAGAKALRPLINNLIRDVLKNPGVKATMKACPNGISNGITGVKQYVAKAPFISIFNESRSAAEAMYRKYSNKLLNEVNNVPSKVNKVSTASGKPLGSLLPAGNMPASKVETFTPQTLHNGEQNIQRYIILKIPVQNAPNPFSNTFLH